MTTTTWDAFFVAGAGATASLTGLVFIGLSINLEQVLAVPGLDLRALEALTLLVTALFLSLLVLVPGQLPLVFAAATIASAVIVAVVSIRATMAMLPVRRRYPVIFGLKVLFAIACVPPLAVAGLAAYDGPTSLGWLAAGVLLAILSACISAWVLLVEINRDRPRGGTGR